MKWDDNLLLDGDPEEMLLRGQWQMAMYAVHLSTGHSIYCRQIKVSTIEDYVLAAASFISSFGLGDVRKDCPSDTHMGHILAPVYRDLKRFETIPDRREPYDLVMHQLAKDLAQGHHPDSLIPALVDGFEQGTCAGYRLSEWAQPAGKRDFTKPQLNHLVSSKMRTRALVPDDFRCLTNNFVKARGLAVPELPLEAITKLWVCFRTQKNGQHGEEKLFTRNPTAGGICFVASAYRALSRFRRLRVLDGRLHPAVTPLSVYVDSNTNSIRLVTSDEIDFFIRKLAAQVYHLHPVKDAKDIRRWGTHSLRVGACVVLHAMGFSDRDIQWILRWRSLAFVTYLRNVAILASRQHRALDKAAAMPHLV